MYNSLLFNHPDHLQFFIDMKQLGYDPRYSEKRFYWRGPCVDCPKTELPLLIRQHTAIKLVWDEVGTKHVTVYPAAYNFESIQAAMSALFTEDSEDIETAIKLSLHAGEPLSILAQNFIDQVWNLVS